jgi:hypothetical protein
MAASCHLLVIAGQLAAGRLSRAQYLRRQRILFGAGSKAQETAMKYRIVIYTMLDHTLCTVTWFDQYGEEGTSRTKLFTFPESELHAHRLEEVLAALAQVVAP